MKTMRYVLALLVLFFVTKSLGGGFHSLFSSLQFTQWHAPIMGILSATALICCFLGFARGRISIPRASHKRGSKSHRMVVALIFLTILAAAIVVRINKINTVSIDIRKADMLPFVTATVDTFLAGENPYKPQTLENGEVYNTTYLPCIWLIFAPARWLKIDIRWTTIIVQVIVFLLLFTVFWRRRIYAWSFEIHSILFLILVGILSFGKLYIGQVVSIQTAALTLSFVLFICAILFKKYWLVPFVAPFVLLSREPAVLLLLPYGIYLWKTESSQFLRQLGITVIMCLFIAGPFIAVAGLNFFNAALNYSGLSAITPWTAMTPHFGASGPLKYWGLDVLIPVVQASGVIYSLFVIATGRVSSKLQAISLGGVSYVTFMLAVTVTFVYVYIEPIILLAFLILGSDESTSCNS